jgi:hypothetical protein
VRHRQRWQQRRPPRSVGTGRSSSRNGSQKPKGAIPNLLARLLHDEAGDRRPASHGSKQPQVRHLDWTSANKHALLWRAGGAGSWLPPRPRLAGLQVVQAPRLSR